MKNKLYVTRNPSATARRLGSETLIMSASNSTLFTLNEIASLIWEAADGLTPLEQVVATTICSNFDVELETALQDAETVVRNLAGHGILELSDLPIARRSELSE